MIVGTGIDLFLTSRFDPHRHDPDFLSQIFSTREIDDLNRPGQSRYRPAGWFALKEAALKARGSGLDRGWAWRSVEVTDSAAVRDHDLAGTVAVHGAAARSRRYSLALVIFEDRTRRSTA